MMSRFFLSVAIASSILISTRAQATSPATPGPLPGSSSYFKNSGFSSCSYVPPHGNSSRPLETHWSQARDSAHFCKAVEYNGTTTILPTNAVSSSFLPSWSSTLLQLFSLSISYAVLTHSVTTQTVKSADGEFSKQVPSVAGLPLLLIALLDFGRLMTWWVLCIRNVRRASTPSDISSLPWLSVVLWALPAFYLLHYRATRQPSSWVAAAGVVTLVQFASSVALVVTRWTRASTTAQYVPLDLPSLGLPARCLAGDLPADLFVDPRASTARGVQTAQMVVLVVGFLFGTALGAKGGRHGFFGAFVAMMVLSVVFLGVSAAAWGAAFRWTAGRCYVTVVFMTARLGYLDVSEGRAGRVVLGLLGV